MTINNHIELKKQLDHLLLERDMYEKKIFDNTKELVNMVTHPAGIIKQSARELASSNDFRKDVFKIGVNLASNYLTRKITNTALNSVLTTLAKRFSKKSANGTPPRFISFLSKILPGIRLKTEVAS
jgi:hypothetical protein